MAKIYFKLRFQRRAIASIILEVCDSRFDFRRFRLSMGIHAFSADWSKRNQRLKVNPANALETHSTNQYLNDVESFVKEYLLQRVSYRTLSNQELRQLLIDRRKDAKNDYVTPETAEQNATEELGREQLEFWNTWTKIINETKNAAGLPITPKTQRAKEHAMELVQEYAAKTNILINFQRLDKQFFLSFDEFMIKKKFAPNTRGKVVKDIKAMLREAEDRDIVVNQAYRKKSVKTIKIDSDSIYLTTEDIRKLIKLDFPQMKTLFGTCL